MDTPLLPLTADGEPGNVRRSEIFREKLALARIRKIAPDQAGTGASMIRFSNAAASSCVPVLSICAA